MQWFNLPRGQVGRLVRGFVNIRGPNVFIPWDTHKRHLNTEREIIVEILQKHKLIKDFFALWNQVYQAISKLGEDQVRSTIKHELYPWKDDKKRDLNIRFSQTIPLPRKKTGSSLPEEMHRPKVAITSSIHSKPIKITFSVTNMEFRTLCSKYGVGGSPDDRNICKDLAEAIKEAALDFRRK
jgi:hypothetical protein